MNKIFSIILFNKEKPLLNSIIISILKIYKYNYCKISVSTLFQLKT